MNPAQSPIPEFEQEMTTTRRLLERVPSDKAEWKPHPKSFPLGHLAQLVAWIPGWVANTASESELDLIKAPAYTFEKTETLVATTDQNVRDAVKALAAMQPADLDTTWKLTRGGHVLWEQPAPCRAAQPRQSPEPSSWPADGVSAVAGRSAAADLRTDRRRADVGTERHRRVRAGASLGSAKATYVPPDAAPFFPPPHAITMY